MWRGSLRPLKLHKNVLFPISRYFSIGKVPEDLNDSYYTGKPFKSTSRQTVLRAMAGNSVITVLKAAAFAKTGSSAMLSETIHSLVDTGNQGLLLLGLYQAGEGPDRRHQYGYGRAAYFWSLISALGMFWLGAGVTLTHGFNTLLNPTTDMVMYKEAWAILGASFCIDGYVLHRVVKEVKGSKPSHVSFFQHLRTIKDPFLMAVFYEDASACAGVLMATAGIAATQYTGNPVYDSIASIGIGSILAGVAIQLIRLNQRYLLGQSVEPEIQHSIRKILINRPAIDNVYSVQSQWVGPSTFSYKAEVDFDGTHLAATLLESYKPIILASKNLEEDLPLLLAWYAEDVTRLVEKEVKLVEALIRTKYPEAAFIELEPDSKESEIQAIDNFNTKSLRKIERDAMKLALDNLAKTLTRSANKK